MKSKHILILGNILAGGMLKWQLFPEFGTQAPLGFQENKEN